MGSAELSRATPREVAFDILKGIGIAEVLIHHTFSFSARKFAEKGSGEWWTLILTNRILHFAIPTFLLVSSILLARSLGKHERIDLRRYTSRRVARSLWPFLIWSLIYLLFRAYFLRVGADVAPYTLTLPWGQTITGPTVLLDPIELRHDLYWGKAYYHLYFLSVLLQLSLMLPALVWVLKRVRLSFGAVALTAAALQLGVYLMQANVWRSLHPASMALWYLPAICIGTWLGLNWDRWGALWASNRMLLFGLAGVSGAIYIALSVQTLSGGPTSNLVYNAMFSLYGTATALSLMGIVGQWDPARRPVTALAALGAVSLPMFVLHPMILHFFGGPRISAVLNAIPLAPILIWGMLLLLTLGFSKLLIAMRLDGLLFGRSYRRELAARPLPKLEPEPNLAGTAI